jgi:hypothetical protein
VGRENGFAVTRHRDFKAFLPTTKGKQVGFALCGNELGLIQKLMVAFAEFSWAALLARMPPCTPSKVKALLGQPKRS